MAIYIWFYLFQVLPVPNLPFEYCFTFFPWPEANWPFDGLYHVFLVRSDFGHLNILLQVFLVCNFRPY